MLNCLGKFRVEKITFIKRIKEAHGLAANTNEQHITESFLLSETS